MVVDIGSTELKFCKLEVTVVHSFTNLAELGDKINNFKNIMDYFQKEKTPLTHPVLGMVDETITNSDFVVTVSWDNTQLDTELKLVDSIESTSAKFELVVYNIPNNTIFAIGDYLLLRWYWDEQPEKELYYHTIIKDIKTKRVGGDLQTTLKGEVVDQNIFYSWGIFQKYPKITYANEIADFIKNELHVEYYSTLSVPDAHVKLPSPILTYGKTVGQILDNFCSQVTTILNQDPKASTKNLTQTMLFTDKTIQTSLAPYAVGKTATSTGSPYKQIYFRWKFINNNTIVFYSDVDLHQKFLNDHFMITVPSINYNDLLSHENGGENYTIEVFGIPTLKAGVVFYLEIEGVPEYILEESAFYVAEEIEHKITCADGYIMKIHCKKSQ